MEDITAAIFGRCEEAKKELVDAITRAAQFDNGEQARLMAQALVIVTEAQHRL